MGTRGGTILGTLGVHVAGGLETPERRNPDSNLGCQENICFSRRFFIKFPNRIPRHVSIRCHQQEC